MATAARPSDTGAPRASHGIRRRDRVERAAGFEPLRALGIELLQKTSGGTWTDHNLHDPGITVLEALCYALTELVYRAEFPVADLLTGPDGTIAFSALSLHEPQEAFPCHATTPDDYRRLLLDRVRGLDDARLLLGPAPGATRSTPGVHRLLLKLTGDMPETEAERERLALGAYREERALGEDVEPVVERVTDLLVDLHADIELSGPQAADELLAQVFHRVGTFIDRSARLVGRHELQERGIALEDIYDGPAAKRGFLADGAPDEGAPATLYISDLKSLVAALPGVKEVHHLSLAMVADGRRSATSLPWGSDAAALRLRVPGDPHAHGGGGPDPRSVRVRRRNLGIEVPSDEVWRRVHDLQAADRAQRFRLDSTTRQQERQDLPRGQWRQPSPYRSVQHHFPAVYGLGPHGVPASAGTQALARMRQMRSYLMLFEQVIANGQAQLEHLRELFSETGARHKSRWWQLLDEDNVPGLAELLLADPETLEREVLAPLDRSAARKSRLLDHLLALHGEEITQNAMRQFCGHLNSAELDQLLLTNKAAFLRQIVDLSRKRGGGFDYSQPLWGHPGNSSVTARRVCLLLGLRLAHARSLLAGLHAQGLRVDESPAPDQPDQTEPSDGQAAAESVAWTMPPAPGDGGCVDPAQLLRERGGVLPAGLLRAGVAHDRYRFLRRAGGDAGALMLRAEEPQRGWWRLCGVDSPAAAVEAAALWREFLRKLNDGCEGMHLVEHVLLRPLAPGGGTTAPSGFHDLRITAVMPDWTVRTHQTGFQEFARQTLRINCPAHLQCGILWLDSPRMTKFEEAYRAWLDLRASHALATRAHAEALAPDVDRAAAAVVALMLARVPVLGADEDDG